MTSPVFYIVVALMLTSAMISVTFFLAWQTLGRRQHTLSWSFAFMAATLQWLFNLQAAKFPTYESYWLTVNGLALVVITLGLKGHCQRTGCRILPRNLWPYAGAVLLIIAWTTVVHRHVGLSTAITPGVAAIALFLSATVVLKHRATPRPAELAAAITMIAFGLTQLATSAASLLQGAEGHALYRELYVNINFLTVPAGYMGTAVFVLFMVASDLSEDMKQLAERDQLTGLLNRRGFNTLAANAYAVSRRSGNPVSVVMSDIDRFKFINDEFGHAAGDLALRHFAEALRQERRREDIIARVGGEEFALVLPGTGLADALQIAEELCRRVGSTPLIVDGECLPMTASFGVATISEKDTCLTDVVVRADRALYRSKREGRNRVDLESSQVLPTIDGSPRGG